MRYLILILNIFITVHFSVYFTQTFSTFSFTSSNVAHGPSQWGNFGCFANGSLACNFCLPTGLPSYFSDGTFPLFSAQTSSSAATSVLDVPHSGGTGKFLTYSYVQSNNLPFLKIIIYFNSSLPANFGGFSIINKSDDGQAKTFTVEAYRNNVLVGTQSRSIPHNIVTDFSISTTGFNDVHRVEIIAPTTMLYFGVNDFRLAGPSALPIELSNFHAQQMNQEIQILWDTESEKNNDYFTLEHSTDGLNWNAIGEIKGSGNSQQLISYSFLHRNPIFGINYYRLKQFDYDGISKIHDVISVDFNSFDKVVDFFPNPTNGTLSIKSSFKSEKLETFKIYNQYGVKLKEIEINLKKGISYNALNLNEYESGMYFIEFDNQKRKIIYY